jgi:5-methylcytosine-specific restriction endonuclease McrA
VHERDQWTCYLCGLPVDPDADCFQPNSPTVDHVIPLSARGEHTMTNCRCACLSCNSSKQDRLMSLTVAIG